MATTGPSSPISDEDIQRLRLVKLITDIGRGLMYRVFSLGCPNKDTNKNLKDYLLQDVGIPKARFDKFFKGTLATQVINNPACDELDVTLMFLAIKFACGNYMADWKSDDWHKDVNCLEYSLKTLKDERNDLFHKLQKYTKVELEQKMEELRNLMASIVERTSERFNLDQAIRAEHLRELHQRIDQVRDQPLTEEEILKYRKKWWLENMKKALEKMHEKLKIISPFSFVDSWDMPIELESVYSELLLEHQDHTKNESVDHNDLLKLAETTTGHRPSCILLKGDTGSGKTTLTKWLMRDWSKVDSQIHHLKTYDLVVPLVCRDHLADSLKSLFKGLLPSTPSHIFEDVLSYIHDLRILFIVDGLDELNTNSRKVLTEILQLSKDTQSTVLCTTRPQQIKRFQSLVPDEYQTNTLEVTGIPQAKVADFARVYHDQLVKHGKSKQSTEDLVRYINKSSHPREFYKFPLNLVLLVFLWAYWPDQINKVTTVTEIYEMLYNMLQERLLCYLLKCESAENADEEEIQEKLKDFVKHLSIEALISLSLDEVILQYPSKKRLKKLSAFDDAIKFKDVASTFLTFKMIRKRFKSEEQIFFPHKDSHDYFAAQALYSAITDRHFYISLRKVILPTTESTNLSQEYDKQCAGNEIIRHVLQVLSKASLDISKYKNVLKHLVGLLSLQDEAKEGVKKELVNLVIEAWATTEAGATTKASWLHLLSETKCDWQIGQFIAQNAFDKSNVIAIQNSEVAGYATILPHLNPKYVILDIAGDPKDLLHMDQLLKVLSEKTCLVVLKQWHYRPLLLATATTTTAATFNPDLMPLLQPNAKCGVQGNLSQLYGQGVAQGLLLKADDTNATSATFTAPVVPSQHTTGTCSKKPSATPSKVNSSVTSLLNDDTPFVCEAGVMRHVVYPVTMTTYDEIKKYSTVGTTRGKPTKTLVLLGTRESKSLFVNTIFNYLYNNSFDNNFRLCLQEEKTVNLVCESSGQTPTEIKILNFDFNYIDDIDDTPDRSLGYLRKVDKKRATYSKYTFFSMEGMKHDLDVAIIDASRLTNLEYTKQNLSTLFRRIDTDDNLHGIMLMKPMTGYIGDIMTEMKKLLGSHVANIINIVTTDLQSKFDAKMQPLNVLQFDNGIVFHPHIRAKDIQQDEITILASRWTTLMARFDSFFSTLRQAQPVNAGVLGVKDRIDSDVCTLPRAVTMLAELMTSMGKIQYKVITATSKKHCSGDIRNAIYSHLKQQLQATPNVIKCLGCDQNCTVPTNFSQIAPITLSFQGQTKRPAYQGYRSTAFRYAKCKNDKCNHPLTCHTMEIKVNQLIAEKDVEIDSILVSPDEPKQTVVDDDKIKERIRSKQSKGVPVDDEKAERRIQSKRSKVVAVDDDKAEHRIRSQKGKVVAVDGDKAERRIQSQKDKVIVLDDDKTEQRIRSQKGIVVSNFLDLMTHVKQALELSPRNFPDAQSFMDKVKSEVDSPYAVQIVEALKIATGRLRNTPAHKVHRKKEMVIKVLYKFDPKLLK